MLGRKAENDEDTDGYILWERLVYIMSDVSVLLFWKMLLFYVTSKVIDLYDPISSYSSIV